MPTYVYKFIDTGETIEVQQAFTDPTLAKVRHPADGKLKKVKKVFQPVGVTFKGTGFYKNDSRGGSSKSSASSPPDTSSSSESSSSSDSTSTKSTETKSSDTKSSDTKSSDTKSSDSKSSDSGSSNGAKPAQSEKKSSAAASAS